MDLIDRQALLRKIFPYEVVEKKGYAINAYAVERAILSMPNRADNEEVKKAIEYLERVLEDWPAFCSGHLALANAIETLLEEFRDEH